MKRALVFVLVFIMLLSAGCSSAVSVVGANINNEGHLVLSMSDGSTIDAGYARGEQGEQGEKGEIGPQGPQGEKGIDGVDGLGIKKAAVNDDGHLMIRLTDDTLIDTGYVVGADGKDGIDGKDGSDGSDGKDGNGNGVLMLADCPIGTTFPCYPNTEFDFKMHNKQGAGTSVHVKLMTLTLTAKYNSADALEDYTVNHSYFRPYVLSLRVEGNAEPQFSGKCINVIFKEDAFDYYVQGYINTDGSFDVTTDFGGMVTAPKELWVKEIVITNNPL